MTGDILEQLLIFGLYSSLVLLWLIKDNLTSKMTKYNLLLF